MSSDIVRVAAKVRAFRADHPITEMGIWTDFTEDEVDGTPRVIGRCRIVHLATMKCVALAYGTRALRAPLPGKQGHQDTRDPDRAMTQATGRALGLLGYAAGDSLEGDTDEPDETEAAPRVLSKNAAKQHVVAVLRDRYEMPAAELKDLGGMCWEQQAMDGRTGWTLAEVEAQVDAWMAKSEPFGDDGGSVYGDESDPDEMSGEGTAEPDSPAGAQHHGGPVASASPDVQPIVDRETGELLTVVSADQLQISETTP